jgi:serine/threonine protein kinase
LKKINHVNLLKCFDTYNTLNNCYIVTEYCNEGDLASILKKKGRYSELEFANIFK